MATALAPNSLLSRFLHKHFVHDPGATSAVLASPDGGTTVYYLDMARVHRALIAVAPTIVGGSGLTLVRIFASTDTAGATNATLLKTSDTIALDNLDGSANSGGDCFRYEVSAQQLREIDTTGVGLRYITIEITQSTNTDEAVVEIFAEGQDSYSGQSATVQA